MNKIATPLSLHFKIKNNSDQNYLVNLFESYKNRMLQNYGNDTFIEVSVMNSFRDYGVLISDLANNPAMIRGMYIKSKHQAKKVVIVDSDDFLRNETPYSVSTGLQNLKDFFISGDCGMKIELFPNEELGLFLRVYRKINRANLLHGKHNMDEFPLQENF